MNNSIPINNKIADDKMIKVSPFKKEIRVTKPHKHNSYFEIIYLSKGSGFHYIDSQRYEIIPETVFLVRKEQIHYWELTSEPDGFVIIIKKKLVEHTLDRELKSLLYQLSTKSVLHLQQSEAINVLFLLLVQEVASVEEKSNTIIEGLLKALLAKITQEAKQPSVNNRKPDRNFCHQFVNLLTQEDTLQNSVAFYAARLHTSPQNLNQSCRKELNNTASQILSEFIVNEAKRLLIYTDRTVAEIAFKLSFNDPSHFNKYFKRFTGSTPQSYRINLI